MINRIRELRKTKKMSQEILANKCDVSRQTINAIENNKYDPSLVLAFKIASTLNITVDDLFQFQLEEKSQEET
ncbi:helix-turn-helix transcriptional regulator [Halobacillus ihumii]|uniref:helix-turn-helix transcriptional regulator n=1 Tax=Halobacillus ihumii TaxID=2686092 RepID=UPI0013D63C09|nr:helix-turn-helix transcriptional regulator [Halobacillus ihumii]